LGGVIGKMLIIYFQVLNVKILGNFSHKREKLVEFTLEKYASAKISQICGKKDHKCVGEKLN
jgi:hypothetical protein